MKILVIIPAYNEEETIGEVIREIRTFIPSAHVLVINDGSKDNTESIAKQSCAEVVTMPYNVGIGGVMQTGYIYAYKNGYDYAVQIDGDGQHRPEDLPRLLQQAKQADMVIGSRYIKKTKYQSSFMRRIGMILFSDIVSLMTCQRFTDTTSGFRVSNRRVIKLFTQYYPTDYPEVEAIVYLKYNGCTLVEVPVEMRLRQGGLSSITPIKSLYYMTKVTLALFINWLRFKVGGYS